MSRPSKTTTFRTTHGTYVLTGFREPGYGMARFELSLIGSDQQGDFFITKADWTTMWKVLAQHFGIARVSAMMREVLP